MDKFWAWRDHGGNLEDSFTKDELLTNVMLHWVKETKGRSGVLERIADFIPAVNAPGNSQRFDTQASAANDAAHSRSGDLHSPNHTHVLKAH